MKDNPNLVEALKKANSPVRVITPGRGDATINQKAVASFQVIY